MLKYLNKKVNDSEDLKVIPKFSGVTFYSILDFKYGKFIEKIYAVKVSAKGIQQQEIIDLVEDGQYYSKNCYYISYGLSAGLHTYFCKKGIRTYYYGCKEYSNLLSDNEGIPVERVHRIELFNLDDIIKFDSSLKYCAYKSNTEIHFMDYLKLYRKHPIAEMLMKLELYRMINEKCLITLENDKTFAKFVFQNKDDIKFMTFTHVYNAYKKKQPPLDYFNSLQWKIYCGKYIALNNKEILKFTTQEKIYDYCLKNKINVTSYNDYISACMFLKLNLEDTKVLFPNNFQEMHDLYIKNYGDLKKLELKEKYKEISLKMEMTADKYNYCNYEKDGYKVIIARNKIDLVNEGEALEHCVGRMDYDERQAKGDSLICFLRKSTEPDNPYATIELNLHTFEIKQCYGFKDSVITDIEDFKNEWLSYIRKYNKNISNPLA